MFDITYKSAKIHPSPFTTVETGVRVMAESGRQLTAEEIIQMMRVQLAREASGEEDSRFAECRPELIEKIEFSESPALDIQEIYGLPTIDSQPFIPAIAGSGIGKKGFRNALNKHWDILTQNKKMPPYHPSKLRLFDPGKMLNEIEVDSILKGLLKQDVVWGNAELACMLLRTHPVLQPVSWNSIPVGHFIVFPGTAYMQLAGPASYVVAGRHRGNGEFTPMELYLSLSWEPGLMSAVYFQED